MDYGQTGESQQSGYVAPRIPAFTVHSESGGIANAGHLNKIYL